MKYRRYHPAETIYGKDFGDGTDDPELPTVEEVEAEWKAFDEWMMKVRALCEMPAGVSLEDLHMLWFEGAPPEDGRDYCRNVAHMNAAQEWDRVCNDHLEHSEYVRAWYGPH